MEVFFRRNKLIGSPFLRPHAACVVTRGRKKEREGWGFSRFWHSGPPVGGSHDGLLAQW
ncbi:hypothetical protein HanPSC8_Chr00c229g0806441 [Helianthus annuus]|nr:hypothetical protein HanPSC8_Chr00c229g0806441 [Helianthus annuus]